MNFLLIPLFSFFDRLSGGWPQVPGRGYIYTLPVFIGLSLLAGLPWLFGLGMSIAYILYRSPAWKQFGGDMTPRGKNEILGTFARHALAIGFAIPIGFLKVFTLKLIILPFVFAALATLIAMAYTYFVDKKNMDIGPYTEFIRGAILGLFIMLMM